MLVIGLTGGIGSGKTTVANLFAKKGITVIDTDQIARDITQPGQPALQKMVTQFGKAILASDGTLNRSALRKKIFQNKSDRLWLEKLLHPLIRAEMKRQAESSNSPYCIAVIPLLFETDRNPLLNRILVIDTPEKEQIKRVQIRDNSSFEDVSAIIKSQTSREERLAGADDIIYNTGAIKELIPQVDKLHQFYLSNSNSR